MTALRASLSFEQRAHARTPMTRSVFVVARGFSWTCLMLDLTTAGARVAFADNGEWPAELVLSDPIARMAHRSRIAWRSGSEVGLQFIETGTFAEMAAALGKAVPAGES